MDLSYGAEYADFREEVRTFIRENRDKQPKSGKADTDGRAKLIRLRREMQVAIDQEDYEQASLLRDEINNINKRDGSS